MACEKKSRELLSREQLFQICEDVRVSILDREPKSVLYFHTCINPYRYIQYVLVTCGYMTMVLVSLNVAVTSAYIILAHYFRRRRHPYMDTPGISPHAQLFAFGCSITGNFTPVSLTIFC